MSVLSAERIDERRRKVLQDRAGLVITPLLDEQGVFDADSVDLRLGCHFLLARMLQQPFHSPDKSSATALHTRVHVPLGTYLVVPAHQTVLGATLEFIKLPHDVCGQILTKSSVARTFVVVETAPWIHPEYRGCLTLEIANVSNTPVLLYPGRRICQLILLDVQRTVHQTGLLDPDYFGPVYPEAPKFKDPEEDLLGIGVDTTHLIRPCRAEKGKVVLDRIRQSNPTIDNGRGWC